MSNPPSPGEGKEGYQSARADELPPERRPRSETAAAPAGSRHQSARRTEPDASREAGDWDRDMEPREPSTSGMLQHQLLRNLLLTVLALFIALVMFLAAALLNGTGLALTAMGAALLALVVLWLLWTFNVHRQRGGLILSLACMLCVGAFVPLLHSIVTVFGASSGEAAAGKQDPAPARADARAAGVPLLTTQFLVRVPEAGVYPQIRFSEDFKVMIGNTAYLVRAGEVLTPEEVQEDRVIVRANDLQVAFPRDVVEVIRGSGEVAQPQQQQPAQSPMWGPGSPGAAEDRPAQQQAAPGIAPAGGDRTQQAQQEIRKRYPALGVKGSPENELFVQSYEQMKIVEPEFFDKPDWPIELGEELAKARGWERQQ